MTTVKYLNFATKRRFGVEVEVTAHVKKPDIKKFIVEIDKDHEVKISEGNDKDHNNNYWKIKRDGSCKDADYGHGWEISSFVGSGIKDIILLEKVIDNVRKNGVKVNNNCSVHIHVDVSDFNRYQIGKLLAFWGNVEWLFLEAVPQRRITSKYCVPLTQVYPQLLSTVHKPLDLYRCAQPKRYNDQDRRVSLNLCNVCYALEYGCNNVRKTLELRLPEGTVDGKTVGNWVKIFTRFVSSCRRKKVWSYRGTASFEDTLALLGLHGTKECSVLLSKGMLKLKIWFLDRIIEFTRNRELKSQARRLLDFLSITSNGLGISVEPDFLSID